MVTLPRLVSRLRRRRAARYRGLLALMASVMLVASACGSSANSKTSDGLTTITIAYPAPVADHMVPAVAAAAGLFKKYGLDVKIKFLQQSELIPALVGGKIQFASLAAPGYEIASLNGSTIQTVAQWEDSYNVMLVSNPKYPTMEDLDGKSIAISSPGAFSDLVAKMAMKKYDIEMTERPLGNLSNSVAAFENGSVDAISDLSPNQLSQVNERLKGAHPLIDFRTMHGVPAIEFIGSKNWMQSHKDTTINVLKGINDGVTYFKTHKDEAVKTIAKTTGQPEEQAEAGYEDMLKAMSSTIVPSVDAEKTVFSFLTDDYPKAKDFDPSEVVDTSYVNAALGK